MSHRAMKFHIFLFVMMAFLGRGGGAAGTKPEVCSH